MNETHDPQLTSWVASANRPGADFPIQNLPFGVFRRRGQREPFRGGVAIGDAILDLAAVARTAPFGGPAGVALAACTAPALNDFMAMGPAAWSELRLALSRALRAGAAAEEALASCLVPQSDAEHALPAHIGDYTDFYTSVHHATRVGALFRPDQPLLPNYKWLPIGYHGRSSSIVISGDDVRRPGGQRLAPGASAPQVGPSLRLDFELELGAFVGPGNPRGTPIAIEDADAHVLGLCLLNDWSARDLQSWEYQPLGPFLSKSFATTISPWIVTLEALEPYRVAWARDAADPAPLSYLESAENRARGAFDIRLESWLATREMQARGLPPQRLCATSFRHAYWTIAQMVAHHTSNGCNLRPGDLLGTGTQSGPEREESGSLLELTSAGKHPLLLPSGEQRGFLEDGDTLTLYAFCERAGAARIGFGRAAGTLSTAH